MCNNITNVHSRINTLTLVELWINLACNLPDEQRPLGAALRVSRAPDRESSTASLCRISRDQNAFPPGKRAVDEAAGQYGGYMPE